MNAMIARSIGERGAKRSPALPAYAATNSASCQLRIGVADTSPVAAIDLEQSLLGHELGSRCDSSCSGRRAAV